MELLQTGGRSRRRSPEACQHQPLHPPPFKHTMAKGPQRLSSSPSPRSRTRSPPALARAPAARDEDGYAAMLPPAEHEPFSDLEAQHGSGAHLHAYAPVRDAAPTPSPLSPTLSLPPHLASYSRPKARHSRHLSATPRSRNAGGQDAVTWQAAGVPTPAGAAAPLHCPASPLQLPPHLTSLQLPRARESLRSEGCHGGYEQKPRWEPEEPWKGREPASQAPGRGQATHAADPALGDHIDLEAGPLLPPHLGAAARGRAPVGRQGAGGRDWLQEGVDGFGDRGEGRRHSRGRLPEYEGHSNGSGELRWPSPASPHWRSRERSPAPRPAREHNADCGDMAAAPTAALPLGSRGVVVEQVVPQLQQRLASGAAGQAPGGGGAPPADARHGGAALDTEASEDAPPYPLDSARAWYWDARQDTLVVGLAWELLERMRQERVATRGW